MTPTRGAERPFFRGLRAHGERQAIVDPSGLTLTYAELAEWADALAPPESDAGRRSLGFHFCRTTAQNLAAYLGGLRAGAAVAMLNDGLSQERAAALVEAYRPDWMIVAPEAAEAWRDLGYSPREAVHGIVYVVADEAPSRPAPHAELRQLVSTSGSTGGGKMVRLSEENLVSNAAAIAEYMALDDSSRALVTLPLHYCFGLSVIHSHLAVGGALLLAPASFVRPEFWQFAREQEASFLAGVPFHFETWQRLGLQKLGEVPLKILAQAGGPLDVARQRDYLSFAEERGARFFVMYGQSEATARISYVPADVLAENLGAIGRPIPGGEIRLDYETGEIVYRGPNVMMGYAEGADDLARGDDLGGVLRTGDVGALNENGLFQIVGRLKRFVKMFGERVSLDELERDLRRRVDSPLACTGRDNELLVAVEEAAATAAVETHLRETYRLRASGLTVVHVDALPRLASGKIDYQKLWQARAAHA